jgi:hypothetical protein
MKSSIYLFKSILLIGLIFSANPTKSQGKLELSGGFGMPELINLKMKYGKNVQVGAGVGIYPFEWFNETVVDWSINADITYHFGGKSKYTEQAPWFISGGLGFFDLGVINPYESYDISFNPRIGRTLNFSKRMGANLDFGLFLPLSASKGYSYDFMLLPSGSFSFFIRL